jgi:anti-sigma B factor antagonist
MKQLRQRRGTKSMIIKIRAVTVHEVPEQVTPAAERRFLQDLQDYVETERPRLVLDCSAVQQMNNRMIHLLLSCLEEAMKRNGDARLAGINPEAKAALDSMGVSRLFEIYSTTAEAVQSFRHRATPSLLSALDDAMPGRAVEGVA